MAKNIVKKANALTNAAYTISLAEQRVILLAVANAKGEPEALKDMTVHASAYAEQWNVDIDTAYSSLKYAANQLFERRFTFQEEGKRGKWNTTVSRWVSHVTYVEGEASITFAFAPHVQPLLSDLKNKFTHYALEQISELTSIHAVRLYELLIAWRSTGETPSIAIEDFRQRLGVGVNEYPRMTDFKRRVLNPALDQINQHTDIAANYEQHKKGRRIASFSFTFTLKNPRDPNTIDAFSGHTDAEGSKPKRKIITKEKAEQMARPGESWQQLYGRLSADYIIKEL